MKVDMILKYQVLDSELFKLEKELKENQNKKKANELHENMKNAQNRSFKLEDQAKSLLNEIEKVKGQIKQQEDKLAEFMSKDFDKLEKSEIEKIGNLKNKLNQNLNILEKNLTSLAETMNAILTDFNKTIKAFNLAKEEYAKQKQAYDQSVKEIETQKSGIIQKLKELSKAIDPNIMEVYLKKRNENIFPVLVPLNGNCCGGCHIELPFANVSKVNEDNMITCEHCRRLVYKI